MTGKQIVLAAMSLSGSLMLAFILAYLLRTLPILAAIILILVPCGSLWLTRRLQGIPADRFHFRGFLFGLFASLVLMGVAFPLGPNFAAFGMARESLAWQALALISYFVIFTIGAVLGAWIAAHIKVTHTPSSGV